MEMKPCPFCGGQFADQSCDRLIIFRCKPCGYDRGFPGLLQTDESPVPIPGTGLQEYYHSDAKEKAIQKMNQRG